MANNIIQFNTARSRAPVNSNDNRVHPRLVSDDRLKANPVPIQMPIGKEKGFLGVIDLVDMKAYTWDDDALDLTIAEIPQELQAEAARRREVMIESVAEFHDALLEKFVEGEPVTNEEIKEAIRTGTLSLRITPVLCGSAFKDKGVQNALDAVIDYLPSPLDVPPMAGVHPKTGDRIVRTMRPTEHLGALVFKTVSDPNGDLTFMRIYSGELRQGRRYLNARRGREERIGRLMQMHANQREAIDVAKAGDIVAAIGLKEAVTGDTICDKQHPVSFEEMTFPETVISMSIEPKKTVDRDRLGATIAKLVREDPTFKARTDDQTGQTIISGMGELHLEVVCSRIISEFKVNVRMGKPKVAYKQTIREGRNIEARHIKQTGGSGQFAVVKIRFEPDREADTLEFESSITGGNVPKMYIPSVRKGIEHGLKGGGSLGFPFVKIRAELYDGQFHEVDSSTMAFEAAGYLAFRQLIENNSVLLEPLMRIEVETPEEHTGDVIGDLSSRRGQIEDMITKPDGVASVRGIVPLAEMFQYSTTLRSLTQGRGHYSMEPRSYEPVPESIAAELIDHI